ncbi:hypothetical protein B566_EDAN000441 [Ephemera danica]|nr:hypothetical protein B566_EDAN000441 [Ephemera danica]
MKASELVMVDFWAVWCGPCQMVAPIVDELAKEYAGKLKVRKLNTDENPEVAGRYQVMNRLAAYQQGYGAWTVACEERDRLIRESQHRTQREELLRFHCTELDAAALREGEDEELQHERRRLSSSQQIGALAAEVIERVNAEGQGILAQLALTERALGQLLQIDSTVGELTRLAVEAKVVLKEMAGQLRDYAERIEADPARLGVIEDRLAVIQKLKKKFGGSLTEVLGAHRAIKDELEQLQGFDEQLCKLRQRITAQQADLALLARQLFLKRGEAAKRMAKVVCQELEALKMGQTVFEIHVTADAGELEFGPDGIDQVEFRLSTNAGEPAKSLSKVASGGELSRVMLALKTVLAERDHVPVLIFDEIDTGVGGAVAAAIGKRLRGLGRYHQVFCITHLPQVAAQGQQHLCVEKLQDGQRTVTTVYPLSGQRRESEIARMLGGLTVTKKGDLLDGLIHREWGVSRDFGGQMIECLGDTHDSGQQRNPFSLKSMWIA